MLDLTIEVGEMPHFFLLIWVRPLEADAAIPGARFEALDLWKRR